MSELQKMFTFIYTHTCAHHDSKGLVKDEKLKLLPYLSPGVAYKCHSHTFKEELHNRFNLISEERVKISKHNSENLMKIG